MASPPPPPTPTRYFGFGSNLWKQQMSLRCPSSPFAGVGRLRGYKWFINARGYANIAPATTTTSSTSNSNSNATPDLEENDDEVWGLVYNLSSADEARLDINEGVPYAYEKRLIPVEFWPSPCPPSPPPSSSTPSTSTQSSTSQQQNGPIPNPDGPKPSKGQTEVVPMLVYLDPHRTTPNHLPRAEYVHRMNMGIRDALLEGIPPAYVEKVLRPYIPADAELGDEMLGLAKKQAAGFRDESGVIPEPGRKGVPRPRPVEGAVGAEGSGVVSSSEIEMGAVEDGEEEAEEGELPERASEVCYFKHFGM